MKTSSLITAATLLLGSTLPAVAHDVGHFSAGEPGNPRRSARTVTVVMTDGDGTMRYSPDRLDVKKGEQVRFVIRNKGALRHEFTLATVDDNDKHAVLMQKYPDMEHDDPNAKTVDPGKTAEILWRFSKAGTFEFACLIPGHREAGMHGTVAVK
ncbi:MAG TPA: cupredoxin family protein [Pseudolabrys sp.]|nr:cupredoxin family protein [Pseudolabrys sp.]